ncbi:MAG TPA: hypothetical protein VJB12_03635 [Candidatus Nanoarchaeia archaeon]|nr:hypothetical protein [Candidatus Nanoarchaeia archaeon]
MRFSGSQGKKAGLKGSSLLRLSLLAIAFLLLTTFAHAISIGISPGRVQFSGVLRDGYAERTVTITTNSEETLNGHFKPGGDLGEWISFSPNTTQIRFSKGSPYKLTIKIQPPSDIPTGNYSGFIEFVTDTVGDVEGRAGGVVKAAVTLIVNAEVSGDQRIECRAGGFFVKDAEQGFPLELGVTVINDGNVRLSPTISFDVWDQLQQKVLLSTELKGDEVLPTTQRSLMEQVSHSLPIGQYWATIRAQECDTQDLVTFTMVEKGGIADSGALLAIINKPFITLGETVEILATFENSGQRAVSAQFKGAIRKDDSIVKLIETSELIVPAGQKVDIPILFTPFEAGRYVVSGRVVYNKKLTFEKNSVINVSPREEEERSWLPLLLYLIIIITIVFLLRKIVRERRRRGS